MTKDYTAEVSKPAHYRRHLREVIEATRLAPGSLSNCIKYTMRMGLKEKEPFLKDAGKALWYAEDLLKNHRAFAGYAMPYLFASHNALREMEHEIVCMVTAESPRNQPVSLHGQRDKARLNIIASLLDILESLKVDGSVAIRAMFIQDLIRHLTAAKGLVDEDQPNQDTSAY